MGSYEILTNAMDIRPLHNTDRILVVASPAYIEGLSNESSMQLLPGLKLAPHAPGEEISADLFVDATLLVIEVDPYDRTSVARIGVIREQRPELPLVAAIQGASVPLVRTLVRQGVTDVVSLPFDLTELLQVSVDAATALSSAPAASTELAPLIVVARSIGGCGATSIATHLAADLNTNDARGRGTIIVDLDLQFGSVADYLGVAPRGNVADLLGVHERLDDELLRSVTAETARGLSVIAAPDSIMPLESVDTDDLLRVIRLLRQQYANVVLDLPANWTSWTLSASLAADTVVLVVELSIASLRQAKRRLELFRSVGIDDSKVAIVVNRVEKRLFRTISLTDVAETLGHPVLGSIALETPVVNTAQNQGMLVGEVQRKSRFVSDIEHIGAQLRSGWRAGGR
ncbi:CpaE family protein [Parafrankia sp. BMG5.11]|uniref:AAA family ATPase n=1 Tax=Parafrankia sp. BMG5.11 TaxID=222540 RepID=UPI0026C04DEE